MLLPASQSVKDITIVCRDGWKVLPVTNSLGCRVMSTVQVLIFSTIPFEFPNVAVLVPVVRNDIYSAKVTAGPRVTGNS